MKRLKRKIIGITLIIFLLLTNHLSAFGQGQRSGSNMDSVEVSLLTCGPRPNVYSLYGHTAIRYQDKSNGTDLAVNYGMFSFGKPFFVLRFVFGLTDYEMGIEYFSDFVANYANTGCGIRQQKLNLTASEKAAIAAAIDENYKPENRVYRYNYFYDNCTTRARNIILSHIHGTVEYHNKESRGEISFREMIHQYNATHRWARFGNDLLLGVKADLPTTHDQQQFLPENLSTDFSRATINNADGSRKLVTEESWVLPRTRDVGSDSFPLSPAACLGLFAIVVLLVTVLERVKQANYWLADAVVMTADGLCGLILLAMVFSQHPTVSLNFQILLLNPLSFFLLVPTVKAMRKRRANLWLKSWTACIVLFLFCGIFQSYAEGMYFVALSLLIRNISKILQFKK